jgi:hypothetical protein
VKVRLLRSNALEELRRSVTANVEKYRGGAFDELLVDGSYSFECDLVIDDALAGNLKDPVGSELFEVENCRVVYLAMSAVSPYEARDERLWAFLSHTVFLEHARRRWPMPLDRESAVAHIHKHFFARDKRQAERDNVASRLWWLSYLCSRVESVELDLALRVFLFRADVRANLVERPTTAQSEELFGAILRKLIDSYEGSKILFDRAVFRRLMKEINSIGGARLLDCLNSSDADELLSDIISSRLRVTAI